MAAATDGSSEPSMTTTARKAASPMETGRQSSADAPFGLTRAARQRDRKTRGTVDIYDPAAPRVKDRLESRVMRRWLNTLRGDFSCPLSESAASESRSVSSSG